MSVFLRSLHPEIEAAQYVTQWTGASWRLIDFTAAPLLPPKRAPQTIHAAIEAAVSETPVSLTQIASTAQVSYMTARQHVERLVKDRRIVRVRVQERVWKRKRAVVLYARVK